MSLRRSPWAFPRSPGPATAAKGACPCSQPATTRATATDAGPVIASILIAVAFAVPLLILGLVALIDGRPEDMSAIMYALARGAEAGTVPGGPAIVVAAESVQAGGQGSGRNPLPAGQRACYNDRLFPENLIRDLNPDRPGSGLAADPRPVDRPRPIPSRAMRRSPRPWPRRPPRRGWPSSTGRPPPRR
jgi:hypothetical protein